jgi:histidinol dehydrogenase
LTVMRHLDATAADFADELERLLAWDLSVDSKIDLAVSEIIRQVRAEGDGQLLALTQRFDGVSAKDMTELEITQEELADAWLRIGVEAQQALSEAAERIRRFHEHQREGSWSFTDELGCQLGQKIQPLDRVGVYVPGGQAAYPSSVLMTLIPAKVAGVQEVIVVSPTPNGLRNDMVLAALHLAGADRVFTLGGAQAVAGLAYGTQTLPRVDKIVGPGNAYVAAAKKQVFGQVGIDMIAGPSEVLVIADGSTDVEWAVLDLFSQAEHDASAQAILISTDADFLRQAAVMIQERLPKMQRSDIIRASLEQRGALIYCADRDQALDVANRIAAEHLELAVADPQPWIDGLRHAGAIFVGAYTGETFGDYIAGPSHVLPTFGTARFASPLGVYDFQKRSSIIEISRTAAQALSKPTDLLATSEGLEAHALAARVRGRDAQE